VTIRHHERYLENLRQKSKRLAQELYDLKSLRDQVRRMEVSDQSERHRQMLMPLTRLMFEGHLTALLEQLSIAAGIAALLAIIADYFEVATKPFSRGDENTLKRRTVISPRPFEEASIECCFSALYWAAYPAWLSAGQR
jgi:hypothetical protein